MLCLFDSLLLIKTLKPITEIIKILYDQSLNYLHYACPILLFNFIFTLLFFTLFFLNLFFLLFPFYFLAPMNSFRGNPRTGPRPGSQQGGQQQSRSSTQPTPCELTCNIFPIRNPPPTLHHYAVTFTPEVNKRDAFARFMRMAENELKGTYAYDGDSTFVRLEKVPNFELRTPLRDGELVCRVEYKGSASYSDSSKRSLYVLLFEAVIRFYQRTHFYTNKRVAVHPSAHSEPLGPGLVLTPGTTSTIRPTRRGLFLNVDVAYCVFYKSSTLLGLMSEVAEEMYGEKRTNEYSNRFYSGFERMLKGIRLMTNHRERKMKFKPVGLLMKGANEVEFEADGEKTSVAAYFEKTYGRLKYPSMPLVVAKAGGRDVYIPVEVLDVVPMQRYMKKLDETQCSRLIKMAAIRPAERFRLIEEKARELKVLENEKMSEFGIAFNAKMANCKGTILPTPEMVFKSGKRVRPANGSWNLAGVSACEGIKIAEWKVFIIQEGRQDIRVGGEQLRTFMAQAERYGVSFGSYTMETVRSTQEFFKAKKCLFNLVVLPDKSTQRYEEVKRIAETYAECYTQCLLSKNVRSLTNAAFVGNLLLKINTKIGGRNWTLSSPLLGDKETILIGIDVTHAAPGDSTTPSVVGIVASMDYDFVTYSSIVHQQDHREEIVSSLRAMVRDLLKRHYSATKKKPRRIIVFRDGVGDSMFDSVFAAEIQSVRDACAELSSSYRPELNFIIAQKRHSVRFSVQGRNPQPGTMVDETGSAESSGLPVLHDFFLVSHTAIQGTARPVRYITLLNESSFSLSQSCTLIYSLCHLYMRASKSVSLVPPVYYAHLAAARGKCYLEENDEGVLNMRECAPIFSKSLYFV